jgi:hypothetical protein
MPFTQPGAAEAPELGTADENVAIAEMVRQGIRKAREKLIDLSLRNGMLSTSKRTDQLAFDARELPSAAKIVFDLAHHAIEKPCRASRFIERHRVPRRPLCALGAFQINDGHAAPSPRQNTTAGQTATHFLLNRARNP